MLTLLVSVAAMVLATADQQGYPSSRMVLCKAIDERGMVFCTHNLTMLD